jgi:hypothetical protein
MSGADNHARAAPRPGVAQAAGSGVECPIDWPVNTLEDALKDPVEDALKTAPSCKSAVDLFWACGTGGTRDAVRAQTVREKCEPDYVRAKPLRRGAEREVKTCWRTAFRDFGPEGSMASAHQLSRLSRRRYAGIGTGHHAGGRRRRPSMDLDHPSHHRHWRRDLVVHEPVSRASGLTTSTRAAGRASSPSEPGGPIGSFSGVPRWFSDGLRGPASELTGPFYLDAHRRIAPPATRA